MRSFSESTLPPLIEDAESGLVDNDDKDDNQLFRSYSASSLPKGSEIFQQVLEEIRREKEAEDTKTQTAMEDADKKVNDNGGDKSVGSSKWKVASTRMLTRTRSFRGSVSK